MSKKKKKKSEPERRTATFREHWSFFSLPFLLTTTVLPLTYSLCSWLINYRQHTGDPNGMLATFWFPITIAALLTIFYFSKRVDLLTFSSPRGNWFPYHICLFGHAGILALVQKIFVDLMDGTPVGDKWMWLAAAYFGTNLFWLIFTYIPVLEREKLRKFKEKRR